MSGNAARGAWILMLSALVLPSAVSGQLLGGTEDPDARCEFLPPTEQSQRRLEFGSWVTETLRPNIRCDDGRQIQADQMTTYESSGLTTFTGNVFFQDDQQTLRAFSANYYEREGRLEASGNVELIDLETGTEISGLGLVYLRAGFGADVERIRVFGGRPRALLFPSATPPDSLPAPPMGDSVAVGDTIVVADSTDPSADSAAVVTETSPAPEVPTPELDASTDSIQATDSLDAVPEPADTVPPEPYEVYGDEIEIVGNDYFKARGQVQILRDSMDARSDSLEYIQTEGRLYLDGNAFVDQPNIDLSAREIMILLPGDIIRDLVARGEGRLLGDRLDLDSPFIRVELDEGELQGLWAAPLFRENGPDSLEVPLRTWDPGAESDSTVFFRPIAVSEDVSMTGDSLDVRAPNQELERVIAIGGARAVSSARDSLNTEDTPELIRDDWIEGDTVTAIFIPNPNAPDSTAADDEDGPSAFLLDRLEATGAEARSLYRLEPAEDAEAGPLAPTAPDSVTVFGAGGEPSPDSVAAGPPVVAAGDSIAEDSVAVSPPVPETPQLAIHYVVANQIIIRMVDGQVETMEVRGLLRGMHQEPIRPGEGTAGGGGDR